MSVPPDKRLGRNVVALGVAALLNDVSSEMIFPLLPAFLTALGAGPAFLGLVEGAADTVSSLLRAPFGWLSDRVPRRKPLVVAGYAVANVARPLVALATAPWHVLAVRICDRVGKGIRSAPRDALLADSMAAGSRGRAFGFHRAMDNLGAVIGPLLGGVVFVLVERDYRRLFVLASVPALLTVAYVVFLVREKDARGVLGAAPGGVDTPVAQRFDRRFWSLLAAIFVFALGNSSDAFLLLRLQDAGVDPVWLPVLWSGLHVVKVVTGYPLGALSDRVGRIPIVLAGWGWYAAVYAAFAVVEAPPALAVVFVAYGVFHGATEGAERALVGDLVPARQRGAAYGLYNAALGVAALPSSLLMGVVWETYGRAAAFSLGAALALLAAVVLLVTGGASRRKVEGS